MKDTVGERIVRRGRDIRVGDIIRVIGKFERVIEIQPYEGINKYLDGPEAARIARFADGSGMTIFPNDWCEVVELAKENAA